MSSSNNKGLFLGVVAAAVVIGTGFVFKFVLSSSSSWSQSSSDDKPDDKVDKSETTKAAEEKNGASSQAKS